MLPQNRNRYPIRSSAHHSHHPSDGRCPRHPKNQRRRKPLLGRTPLQTEHNPYNNRHQNSRRGSVVHPHRKECTPAHDSQQQIPRRTQHHPTAQQPQSPATVYPVLPKRLRQQEGAQKQKHNRVSIPLQKGAQRKRTHPSIRLRLHQPQQRSHQRR